MDAFFASVEQRDDPSLRGKPVIVGGPSQRGVVAAASYEIRKFGVRSAMSMAEALRRCPEAIVVAADHDRYAEVSRQVFAIFHRFTPLVEGLSLDEAFLDVTASRTLYGDGETIARRIKEAIHSELDLTASAGVAPSKFVAKIASDLRKPDGLVVVRPEEVRALLDPLPVERMWGLGEKSAKLARSYGWTTFRDLARAKTSELVAVFGQHGAAMGALARGEDDREVVPDREAKSIGAEETFERDLVPKELPERLLSQSMRVAERLHDDGLAGTTVTVKVKLADFTLRTRSMQPPEPVSDTDAIYGTAKQLLARFDLAGQRVRLTGVQVSGLVPRESTRTLFPDEEREKRKKLEDVRAALRDRFGKGALTRATLLDDD